MEATTRTEDHTNTVTSMHGCIVKETLGYCRECDDEVVITLAEIEDRFVEDFYDREDK